MSAYVIVDIDVHDAPGLEEYRKQVPATIAQYGGRFVVRGGQFETLEGHWQPKASRRAGVPQRRTGQALVRLRGVPPAQGDAIQSVDQQSDPRRRCLAARDRPRSGFSPLKGRGQALQS